MSYIKLKHCIFFSQVNKCLSSAMVPGQKKNPVAEVMILEHSNKKGVFFFPGLKDIPEVQMKGTETVSNT